MASINKTFEFHAGHRLPNHNGKCSRLHGHTYKLDIMVTGNVNDVDGDSSQGMVIDFGILKEFWQEVEDHYDHRTLLWEKDDILDALRSANGGHGVDLQALGIEVTDSPPTAEYIAEIIFRRLWQRLAMLELPIVLDAVRVWETPTSWALFDGRHLHFIKSEVPFEEEDELPVRAN